MSKKRVAKLSMVDAMNMGESVDSWLLKKGFDLSRDIGKVKDFDTQQITYTQEIMTEKKGEK